MKFKSKEYESYIRSILRMYELEAYSIEYMENVLEEPCYFVQIDKRENDSKDLDEILLNHRCLDIFENDVYFSLKLMDCFSESELETMKDLLTRSSIKEIEDNNTLEN